MSWFDGWEWDSGDDSDAWDSGDWDDAWDYGEAGDGGDFSDQGYDWDAVFGSGDSGEAGTNWWSSFTGNNGQSTNWMNMLLQGTSSYLGDRSADRRAEEGREHDIALTILRDQLANQEYQRRQQELKDAYKGYEGFSQSQNPMSLLSGRGYANTNRQPGATYYGS